MKKVLVLMMILAQSAVVSAQPGEAEDPTGHISPIADEGGVLKGQRQMPEDNTPPVIRVVESSANPQPPNYEIYSIYFGISSSEDIVGLASTASYKIARCLNAACTTQDTMTYTPSRIINLRDLSFGSGISAEITLNSLEEIRATWGFALLRASGSVLQDVAGKDPVNTNGMPIGENGIVSIVSRDRTSPRFMLSIGQVRRIGDSNIYELVFLVNRPEDKFIPTLYEEASYQLISVSNADDREDITDDATLSPIPPPRVSIAAKLTYRVTVTDSELGSIKGFMVARAGADDLWDRWSNLPVRAEDDMPIGTGTNGLLRSTPVGLIQPRIRTKVFLGGPLR